MKRVCLTGVESTGKSSLALHLAVRFGGVVMPEYGRLWAETHGLDFTTEALRDIALGHLEARETIEARRPTLIVEDTDIVMTGAWARMLYGARDPFLNAIPASADLYLLFARDTPWIDDGTRQFGGRERARFDVIIRGELTARGITAVPIGGNWQARQAAAEAALAELLGV